MSEYDHTLSTEDVQPLIAKVVGHAPACHCCDCPACQAEREAAAHRPPEVWE